MECELSANEWIDQFTSAPGYKRIRQDLHEMNVELDNILDGAIQAKDRAIAENILRYQKKTLDYKKVEAERSKKLIEDFTVFDENIINELKEKFDGDDLADRIEQHNKEKHNNYMDALIGGRGSQRTNVVSAFHTKDAIHGTLNAKIDNIISNFDTYLQSKDQEAMNTEIIKNIITGKGDKDGFADKIRDYYDSIDDMYESEGLTTPSSKREILETPIFTIHADQKSLIQSDIRKDTKRAKDLRKSLTKIIDLDLDKIEAAIMTDDMVTLFNNTRPNKDQDLVGLLQQPSVMQHLLEHAEETAGDFAVKEKFGDSTRDGLERIHKSLERNQKDSYSEYSSNSINAAKHMEDIATLRTGAGSYRDMPELPRKIMSMMGRMASMVDLAATWVYAPTDVGYQMANSMKFDPIIAEVKNAKEISAIKHAFNNSAYKKELKGMILQPARFEINKRYGGDSELTKGKMNTVDKGLRGASVGLHWISLNKAADTFAMSRGIAKSIKQFSSDVLNVGKANSSKNIAANKFSEAELKILQDPENWTDGLIDFNKIEDFDLSIKAKAVTHEISGQRMVKPGLAEAKLFGGGYDNVMSATFNLMFKFMTYVFAQIRQQINHLADYRVSKTEKAKVSAAFAATSAVSGWMVMEMKSLLWGESSEVGMWQEMSEDMDNPDTVLKATERFLTYLDKGGVLGPLVIAKETFIDQKTPVIGQFPKSIYDISKAWGQYSLGDKTSEEAQYKTWQSIYRGWIPKPGVIGIMENIAADEALESLFPSIHAKNTRQKEKKLEKNFKEFGIRKTLFD